MSPWARRLTQAAIIAGFVLVWHLTVAGRFVDPMLLPGPAEVFARMIHLLGDAQSLHHLGVTLGEVMLAVVLVTPVGIALGLFLGENAYWGAAFRPLFYFMSSVPKSVFLPVFILALGMGFSQKVAFGMFQAIFVLVVAAIAAAQSVPVDYVRTARSFGATRAQIYRHVYLPAMLPVILEGLRLGMIFNITGVLFAEMYVSRAGLGYLIANWGMNFDIVSLLAGIVLASLVSIMVNEALRWYEHRVGAWRS
ncbi:ABC transporter permease [Caballeronia sp. LZ034LL]|uniref:ABC transporter permease n=1 Tax=Caballeronia sp. LZ034LL TaxID=3038567 RepID=UPI00285B2478|nr:ABC transporter permease [Caballeronia sp. LZ034LL]MDR5837473.1 ABC transporter permease [Caballeronia sp. LZ034LL]